jgi:2-hydroxyacyl-CoA lyase 1
MAEISGGSILVKALRNEGVDTVFNLPGDPMALVYEACKEKNVRIFTFRHEQAAGLAAQVWSYTTGRIGVAMVASGPAMTNAVTALETARSNCWPFLLIGGSGDLRRRGRGDFQEAPQVAAAQPFCKLSIGIDDPHRIPYYVNTAIRTALSGRPGPVYLDLPSDVITEEVDEDEVHLLPPVPPVPRPAGDPAEIRRALDVIEQSERPLLLIGKGVAWSGGADQMRTLVDRLQIPFVPSPMGKGIVPDDHPLCAAGARSYALSHADAVILAGARMNWIFHFGEAPRFDPDVKVIQIDIEPSEIGHGVPATVGIAGDARSILQQLVDEAGSAARRRLESGWLESIQAERQKNEQAVASMVRSDDAPMNLYRMFHDVSAVLERDATVAVDGENTMAVSRAMLPNFLPAHRLDAGESGCMGVSVPYALGAAVARPGTQILSMNGDFAFGWNGMEIETAIRHQLPIVFVVANNGSIGAGQPRSAGDGPSVIRYDKMMDAFGGHAEFVATPAELKPALQRAFASGRPALLNVAVLPQRHRKEQPFEWLGRRGRMEY